MTKDKVEELKEKFDTLIELGVVFAMVVNIEQGELPNVNLQKMILKLD